METIRSLCYEGDGGGEENENRGEEEEEKYNIKKKILRFILSNISIFYGYFKS